MMMLITSRMMLFAAAVATQLTPARTGPPQQPAIGAAAWNPAGPYIAEGQDEPGYRSWYLAAPWRAAQVKAFNDYLNANQVGGVLPTWTLLRTATAWRECGQQPFQVAPSSDWPNMVQTLRYVRDHVVPEVGPVEAVSVYRNPQLNKCAGGAPESAHQLDSAIDMVPLTPIDRVTLMRKLCGDHSEHGAQYNAGLGFYAYLRFHVDSIKYRRWNMDPAVAQECPPIIHPEDVASVGQPLPPSPETAPSSVPAAIPPATPPAVAAQPMPSTTSSPERGQSQ